MKQDAVLGSDRSRASSAQPLRSDASPQPRAEIETQIADMLDESVRMQLVSDVPVGVFLSGGIDSSSLVGILSRNGVRPSTFSIVFREADYSEAEYSRADRTAFSAPIITKSRFRSQTCLPRSLPPFMRWISPPSTASTPTLSRKKPARRE